MASKKRSGLGKSLSQIMAEEGRIDVARAESQIIPTQRPQDSASADIFLDNEFRLIPQPDRVAAEEELTKDPAYDFDTQFVEDAKPPKNNYGQGPTKSTRVAAHKFVPSLMSRAGTKGGSTLGTVYVKFQPKMNGTRANDIYRYKNVPESMYKQFAESNSKGRFINNFLNSFPYSRATTREERYHAKDFR